MACSSANIKPSVSHLLSTPKREKPNILITGNHGVGKSTLCENLARSTGFNWIEVSQFARQNDCYDVYDDEYLYCVMDDDKLVRCLENTMSMGGNIVDYHSSNPFREDWFDIVYVLRVINRKTLRHRLAARRYTNKKLEHIDLGEFYQTALSEAHVKFLPRIVNDLLNCNFDDMNKNVETIHGWVKQWSPNKK